MNQVVTRLNTEINEVYEQIQMFLRKKGLKSDKTATSYEKDIKDFFKVVRDKDINELNKDDIQVTLDDFDRFILEMVDTEKYENATINRKVNAVRSLLKYLAAKKLVDDISYFSEIERLPENIKGYGILTVDEVKMLAKLALQEREKKMIKHCLIRFALDTRIRKSALLNLKWSDIEPIENGAIIKGIDKGNKFFKRRISQSLYNDLLSIKTDNEKVFPIDRKTVDRMMKRLLKKMNIPEERHIVFHSIRKAGISFHYDYTKDPLSTMKAAGHSNFQTTLRYINDNDVEIMGVISMEDSMDNDLFRKVDHEVLIQAIEKLSFDHKIILNMKIKEILNQK
jgi:integrase